MHICKRRRLAALAVAGALMTCPAWAAEATQANPAAAEAVTPAAVATPADTAAAPGSQPGSTIMIQHIEFTGNHLANREQLLKALGIKEGSAVDSAQIGKGIAAIEQMYNKSGFILAKVTNADVSQDGTLQINVAEGKIEDVTVKGNTKTKTRVITRELRFKKGDYFNSNLVRRSVERVYNTGYFEDVNVQLLPGQIDKNNVIVEIDVLEQKTGTISIGAGYSDSDGVVGILGLSDTNLRGTGDKASINWEFGGHTNSKTNYVASYTHPWVNDYGDSIGFNIFDREYEYKDYDENGDSVADYYKRSKGFNIVYGRSRSEYVSDYFTLETKNSSYTSYEGGYDYRSDGSYPFATDDYLGHNFGRTNSLSWAHVLDTRDNIYNPTRGKRVSLTGTMAGHGLGGDFSYYKLVAEGRSYHKVGRAHVLALRLMGGWGSGDIPYSDLFALGGSENLRGYEDDQFKGNRMYEATVEYRYPIMKKVQGVVFADAGDAWGGMDNVPWYQSDRKLHASVGLGVRVTTPLGPVRLDFAEGSDGNKFHFSFGGQF